VRSGDSLLARSLTLLRLPATRKPLKSNDVGRRNVSVLGRPLRRSCVGWAGKDYPLAPPACRIADTITGVLDGCLYPFPASANCPAGV
jgi:hypothetical protein